MVRRFLILGGFFVAGLFLSVVLSHPKTAPAQALSPSPVVVEPTGSMEDVVDTVLRKRTDRLTEAGEDAPPPDQEIHVLLLGLDVRKEEREPHCDAIHLFSFHPENGTLRITSVPRGTYAYVPSRITQPTEQYLANACAYESLDYGIEQIEKVLGVQADYVATVGFSQALGIFRLFDLPTTETLQWLRHRQSYAIGDPQRSHNQAVFMKDMLVAHLDAFRSKLSVPFQYLLYSLVDSDMDFATARILLKALADAEVDRVPERIELAIKPFYPVADYHLDLARASEQIAEIAAFLAPLLSKEDLSGRSIEDIQAELVAYLDARLLAPDPVADVMEKRLWLQVEDAEVRERLHSLLLERYVRDEAASDVERFDLLTDYVLEQQALGNEVYMEKGKALLAEWVSPSSSSEDAF
ncbi:hypothetical protein HY734_02595 [Candidatus Uhrbacteria bacterium]|nr:hypothetical protein [Candidatus Uhrbacteria bacterium]